MILSAFEQLFLLGQKRLDTGCDGALFKLQARDYPASAIHTMAPLRFPNYRVTL